MSKQFRARLLDWTKRMPIYFADEIPDLAEYAAVNRSVPQMPSGMEREEEMEVHLQQAISAQQASTVGVIKKVVDDAIIPIPKVESGIIGYDQLYGNDFKLPHHFIRVQAALSLEPEYPDYDLDDEDEKWINYVNEKLCLDMSPLQFERIMDVLEKQSEFKVISVEEAKILLQDDDDDVIFAVYDYWLNKRYKVTAEGQRLIPKVRVDRREATSLIADPYVGFRRRAEKMQTRKNRKNDEDSYEKILKLRSDLQKALTLLEMVKRREKSKRELIKMGLEIAHKRLEARDFVGDLFLQIRNEVKPSFQFSKEEMLSGRSRRFANKRSHGGRLEERGLVNRQWLLKNAQQWNKPALFPNSYDATPSTKTQPIGSSVSLPLDGLDRSLPGALRAAEKELSDPNVDGIYMFKRRRGCAYLAPISDGFHAMRRKRAAADIPTALPTDPSTHPHPALPVGTSVGLSPSRCPYAEVRLTSRYPELLNVDFSKPATFINDDYPQNQSLTPVGLIRRRIGRGGRLVFDRHGSSGNDSEENQLYRYDHSYVDQPSSSKAIDASESKTDPVTFKSNRTNFYYPSSRSVFEFDALTATRAMDFKTPVFDGDSLSSKNNFHDNHQSILNSDTSPLIIELLNDNDNDVTVDNDSAFMTTTKKRFSSKNDHVALVIGPQGRLRLPLRLGVASQVVFDSHKRRQRFATSKPYCSSSSSPSSILDKPSIMTAMDSRLAFEASAAVMNYEDMREMRRLASRYDNGDGSGRLTPPHFTSPPSCPASDRNSVTLLTNGMDSVVNLTSKTTTDEMSPCLGSKVRRLACNDASKLNGQPASLLDGNLPADKKFEETCSRDSGNSSDGGGGGGNNNTSNNNNINGKTIDVLNREHDFKRLMRPSLHAAVPSSPSYT